MSTHAERLKIQKKKLTELYEKYDLSSEHFHKQFDKSGKLQYTIINREGIEIIQAKEQLAINYEVIRCEPNFAAIKASTKDVTEKQITTFASAIKGESWKDGNTQSWYVLEIAEKRAMSRLILKYLGLYKLGFFGEDESDDFNRKKSPVTDKMSADDMYDYISDLVEELKDVIPFEMNAYAERVLELKEVSTYKKLVKELEELKKSKK